MDSVIGAYDAKTHLPELLKKVQAGMRFTITLRGLPVAELGPAGSGTPQAARAAASRMGDFMRQHSPITGLDIKALIEEGRD